MTRLCIPLEQLDRTACHRLGGRAPTSARLIRAGFAVPRGFVVATAQPVRGGRPGPYDERGDRRPRHAADVRTAVQAAYGELGGGPVAVRSSATLEDLPGAAFAGQQDTFLNVVGPHAVVDAVRDCWASLWAERAVAYRATPPPPADAAESVAMAVVVQQLVPADWAGVMFTANPVTGAGPGRHRVESGSRRVGRIRSGDPGPCRHRRGRLGRRAARRSPRGRGPADAPEVAPPLRPATYTPALPRPCSLSSPSRGERSPSLRCTAGHRVGPHRRRDRAHAVAADDRPARQRRCG